MRPLQFIVFPLLMCLRDTEGKLDPLPERNITAFATGFSEICKAIGSNSIVVLIKNTTKTRKVDEFIQELHKLGMLTYLFVNQDGLYLDFIASRIKGSINTASLIFAKPDELIEEIQARNLAHRLCLFMFYWGLDKIENYHETVELKEPLKLVYITHPRKKVYRIYFNRATADGSGKMMMVNWFDANSLGLYREPLLPATEDVYRKLAWRTIYVPAVNTPPWLQVMYNKNDSSSNATSNSTDYFLDDDANMTESETVTVTGGRDDTLLRLISKKMEFHIRYVDPPERTQGIAIVDKSEGTLNFTGGIGMIQRREADLFLGDIPLSWERQQAAEFTFFTLADSGAFVTHAPRKLNEALVLVRPFMWNVWSVLLLTVLMTVPAFYFIIIMPYVWKDHYKHYIFTRSRNDPPKSEVKEFHAEYVNEITYGHRNRKSEIIRYKGVPKGIFGNVAWFVVNLYLKQSVTLRFKGHRVRFLTIVVWLGSTYVLADMYSAQLTSQLARPAKEVPINTLSRLEQAMKYKGYLLYVEKDSAAETIIKNGTGTFQRLFNMMKHQPAADNENPYEVKSIQQGMKLIVEHGSRAILGGRGTIYFNTKKLGPNNFQISEKLYTRYSAFVVQNGCLFLDSLNRILISLFEAGILEQMTTIEYEKMLGVQSINREQESTKLSQNNENVPKKHQEGTGKLEPISIEMLQGAFLVLLGGHTWAGVILLLELLEARYRLFDRTRWCVKKLGARIRRCILRMARIIRNHVLEIVHELF